MARIQWDIENHTSGRIENVGDYVTTAYNVHFAKVNGDSYDYENKTLHISPSRGYVCSLNHNTDFRIWKDGVRFRIVMKLNTSGIIFGTYNMPINGFYIALDVDNKKLKVFAFDGTYTLDLPEGFIQYGINDLQFKLMTAMKKVSIKNMITNEEFILDVPTIIEYNFTDGAPFGNYDQVLGVGSRVNLYNGYPADTVTDMEIYHLSLTYDSYDAVVDGSFYKYLYEKDGEFFSVDKLGIKTSQGTDKEIAFTNTPYDTLHQCDELFTAGTKIHERAHLNNTQHSTLTFYKDIEPVLVYYKNAEDKYIGLNDVVADPDIDSVNGIPLATFNSTGLKDIYLKIPKNVYSWGVNEYLKLEGGTLDSSKLVEDGVTYTKTASKNCMSYGTSYTENFHVTKHTTLQTEEIIDHVDATLKIHAYGYGKSSEGVARLNIVNPNDGIEARRGEAADPGIAYIFVADEPDTMFSDVIEIDMGDAGISNIDINLDSFLSITIPNTASVRSKPAWLSLSGNKVSGIPDKAGKFKLELEISGVSVTSTINVSRMKRKK